MGVGGDNAACVLHARLLNRMKNTDERAFVLRCISGCGVRKASNVLGGGIHVVSHRLIQSPAKLAACLSVMTSLSQ
jgi:hypothetical protein